jgi:hypothetical protein
MRDASKVVFRDVYNISFEAVEVYEDIDCDIAYGTLKVNGFVAPGLRLCLHKEIRDLAVAFYGEYVLKVEKAPFYVYIPPHRYVAYSDTPSVVLLLRPSGYVDVLFCRADKEVCRLLREAFDAMRSVRVYDDEHAFRIIENVVASRQQHAV